MKDFEKLMKKGEVKKMDPDVKSSKMSVLKELHKMMGGMMGDDLKQHMGGLKKVTVAAPDKEGLEMGLNKAEELLGGKEEDSMEEESEEMPMSDEEIEEKIKELQAMKSKSKMKF